MDVAFTKLAKKAEKSFSTTIDFSDDSALAKISHKILEILDKFRIGPRVLMLLAVFGFPEKSREKIWKDIHKVVRKSKQASASS